jgi:flagellar basal body rod protein FlgC
MNPISSVSAISLSGMQAAQTRLQASAHNIANAGTEDFHREEVVQEADPAGGVHAEVQRAAVPGDAAITDAVAQIAARQDFLANLAVFKSSNQMLGALLDTQA